MKKIGLSVLCLLTLCVGIAQADLISPRRGGGARGLSESQRWKRCEEMTQAMPAPTIYRIPAVWTEWANLNCDARMSRYFSTYPPQQLLEVCAKISASQEGVFYVFRQTWQTLNCAYRLQEATPKNPPAPKQEEIKKDKPVVKKSPQVARPVAAVSRPVAANQPPHQAATQHTGSTYVVAGLLVLLLCVAAFVLLWRVRKK